MTADLHLLAAPVIFEHLPTRVEAMEFAPSKRRALEAWLIAELGREHFAMTPTHLVIETAQGDSRECNLGDWVIKRRTRHGFEFYPVEAEVIEDTYKKVPA